MKSLHVSARACLFPVKSQRAQAVWGKPLFTHKCIAQYITFSMLYYMVQENRKANLYLYI